MIQARSSTIFRLTDAQLIVGGTDHKVRSIIIMTTRETSLRFQVELKHRAHIGLSSLQ